MRADLGCIIRLVLTGHLLGTGHGAWEKGRMAEPHPHETRVPLGEAGQQVSKPVASHKG